MTRKEPQMDDAPPGTGEPEEDEPPQEITCSGGLTLPPLSILLDRKRGESDGQ